MAAAPGIQKPGKKFGPCKTFCAHRDCAQSRAVAACVCRFCQKAIGYETRFYDDERDSTKQVHADCFEDWIYVYNMESGRADVAP